MLEPARMNRIYRVSAWYDLAVALPFATPMFLAVAWAALQWVHLAAGLPALPDLDAHGALFANFFGTIVALWAIVRLRSGDPAYARFDAVGRWLFSAWMAVALAHGATPLLWGFLAVELAFGVLQSLPVRSAAAA
ncbi:hypothetical protein GCM10007893_23820 [Paracoccus marinus]|nr:hypothetical protein GCM10007893_23820 [Paracoccus marinus]